MLVLPLALILTSSKPLGQVMIGNWTGTTVYTTSTELPEYFEFVIRQDTNANHLKTEFRGEDVFIALSSTDLSGNVTYLSDITDFNFSTKITYIVSGEAEFPDAKIHCSLASYTTAHCSILHGNSSQFVLFTKDALDAGRPWILRNWKFLLGAVCLGIVQLFMTRLTSVFRSLGFASPPIHNKTKTD